MEPGHFSKIDLTNVYLQIPLSSQSKSVNTIITSWGLFQSNLLSFGLHVSRGIFEASIDKVIKVLDGGNKPTKMVALPSVAPEKNMIHN